MNPGRKPSLGCHLPSGWVLAVLWLLPAWQGLTPGTGQGAVPRRAVPRGTEWPAVAEGSSAVADSVGRPPSRRPSPLQDSVTLYRLTSGWLPPDGLLRVKLGLRAYNTTYQVGSGLRQARLRDLELSLAYGLRPGLHLLAQLPLRSWREAPPPFSPSGSGLGDGRVLAVVGLPRPASWWAWALRGGATLPTGASGLTEGEISPEAGLALSFRFWADSLLPEMRLHLNLGYRRNGNDREGFGVNPAAGFQPWFPRYPAVAEGGAASANDFLLLGAALEFRQETTTLFVEYTETRLPWADGVAAREWQRCVTPGLRWGRVEGWALAAAFDVSLALEEPATPFTAAYPDLVWYFALSHQFPLGGKDSDGDGIPDRRDHCPRLVEDRDHYADDDGCPDWDNDEDGVPDAQDLAPDLAEDRDGFQDGDGLPDPDNDLDGIPDLVDDCPDVPEDFDGYQDSDGCPEEFYDRDGDGIEDDQDRCPDVPEDADGFEDGDGCPDLDNDLDGIPDAADACPGLPEDYNGVDDDDGCPDGQGK